MSTQLMLQIWNLYSKSIETANLEVFTWTDTTKANSYMFKMISKHVY